MADPGKSTDEFGHSPGWRSSWPSHSLRLTIFSLVLVVLVLLAVEATASAEDQCIQVDPDDQRERYEGLDGSRMTPAQCSRLLSAADISRSVYADPEAPGDRQENLEDRNIRYERDWSALWDDRPALQTLLKSRADDAGFSAGIYETNDTVYVAFAGTEFTSLADWQANISRGLVGDSTQHLLARAVGRQAKREYADSGKEVVFVGHSLGGGLAMVAAHHTGLRAQVFNTDGVLAETAREFDDTGTASRIDNVYVSNDVLSRPANCDDDSPLYDAACWDVFRERLEQPGNRMWLPHYEQCRWHPGGLPSQDAATGAFAVGASNTVAASAGRVAGSLARVLPYTRFLAMAGPPAMRAMQDIHHAHTMDTVHAYLKSCAAEAANDRSDPDDGEQVAGTPTSPDAGTSLDRTDNARVGGPDAERDGTGTPDPPEIQYECKLSCD